MTSCVKCLLQQNQIACTYGIRMLFHDSQAIIRLGESNQKLFVQQINFQCIILGFQVMEDTLTTMYGKNACGKYEELYQDRTL